MTKKTTRLSNKWLLSEYLGSGGTEFAPSELPTLRDVLLKGLLLKEEQGNRHSYKVKDLSKDILPSLLEQWTKANAEFRPPVITVSKAITDRIERAWETASNIAMRKITKKNIVEQFNLKLDKLFDLTKCQCSIFNCEESGCSGCSLMAHINCSCSR